MNSQSRGYAIILYLIWPFSALFIGLKNFDSTFGKKVFIALYAFLGFTAISVGDLEHYEGEFYDNKTVSFSEIISNIVTLQDGKLFYSIASFSSGLIFELHHFYFLILFLIYGFFYINTVHLLKMLNYKKLGAFGLLFFLGLLMFMLIRPVINTAFYTGGVFLLFLTVSYYKTSDKKFLFLFALVPIFHMGLTIYLIVPLFLFLFKNKTWFYVIFVGITFLVGKSSVVGSIEGLATSNSGTILDSKYEHYASEKGQEYLEARYAEGAANSNIKLKSLVFLSDAVMYLLVPIGLILVFLKRNYLLYDQELRRLFHIVLLFWGVANLMLNISQGVRFVILFGFLGISLLYTVYIRNRNQSNIGIFNKFTYLFVPVLFLNGLMLTYASNEIIKPVFFISNFFIEIFNYS